MASRVFAQAGPSFRRSATPGKCTILDERSIATRVWSSELFRKSFSTSSRCSQGPDHSPGKDVIRGETHYDTLGVPHGASRMEIKAAYFRLSKRYHPDVRRIAMRSRLSDAHGDSEKTDKLEREKQKRKDAEAEKRATERFHEVSAAYKVLSDDRQRRAYDRSLASPVHTLRTARTTHGDAHTPGSSHTHAYAYELHSRRRRGATYAWENAGPRAYTGRTHTHTHTHAHTHPHTSSAGDGRHYDPSSSPFASYQYHAGSSSNASSTSASFNSGTGAARGADFELGVGVGKGGQRTSERLSGRSLRNEEERIAHDRIVRESNVSRFFRALGIILVVSWVGSFGKSVSG